MARNATSFSVVDLQSDLGTNLNALNVEEASNVNTEYMRGVDRDLLDVMSTSVQYGEEKHGISDLSMEPH
jgi:hypothetical protein